MSTQKHDRPSERQGRRSDKEFDPSLQTLVHWLVIELMNIQTSKEARESWWGSWFEKRLERLSFWDEELKSAALKRRYAEKKKTSSWRSLRRHELALLVEIIWSTLSPTMSEQPEQSLLRASFNELYQEYERSNRSIGDSAHGLPLPDRWITVLEWALPRLASLIACYSVKPLQDFDLKELKPALFSVLDDQGMRKAAQLAFRLATRSLEPEEVCQVRRKLSRSLKRLLKDQPKAPPIPKHNTLFELAKLGSQEAYKEGLSDEMVSFREIVTTLVLVLYRCIRHIREQVLEQLAPNPDLSQRAKLIFDRFKDDLERAHLFYSSHISELDRVSLLSHFYQPQRLSHVLGRGVYSRSLSQRLSLLGLCHMLSVMGAEGVEHIEPPEQRARVGRLIPLCQELLSEGYEPHDDGAQKAAMIDELYDQMLELVPPQLRPKVKGLDKPEIAQFVAQHPQYVRRAILKGELDQAVIFPVEAAFLYGMSQREWFLIKQVTHLLKLRRSISDYKALNRSLPQEAAQHVQDQIDVGFKPMLSLWSGLQQSGEAVNDGRRELSWLLILAALLKQMSFTHPLLDEATAMYERLREPLVAHEGRALAEVACALWWEGSADRRTQNPHRKSLVQAGAEGLLLALSENREN